MSDAEKKAWDKWAAKLIAEALHSPGEVVQSHTVSAVAPRYVRKVVKEADNG